MQRFEASGLRGQFVIQVTDEGDPRLGIIRWPVLDAVTRLLSYDLTEGSGGRDPTDPAKVRAVVTVDGGAASRWVVVIERKLDGEWRVAGVGQTAESGRAEIPLEVTAGGTTYAMGLDDWGAVFEPRLAVSLGQRVRPTIFSGWLYEVTEAGVLPAAEPGWWPIEGDNPSRQVGTARLQATQLLPPAQPRALSCRGSMINREFRRPLAEGGAASVRAVPPRWQRLVFADARSGGLWGSGRPLARRCASGWSGVPVRDAGWGSGWEHAEQRNAAARSAWDSTRVLDVERARLGSDAAPA
ncbi:hypothetical protein AAHB60_31795 [Pseudomonas aeruginosa]